MARTVQWLRTHFFRLTLGCALVGGTLFVGARLILKPTVSASVEVMPVAMASPMAGIASVAAELGVSLPGISPQGDPVRTLSEIAGSRDLAVAILSRVYPTSHRSTPMTLWDVYGVDPSSWIDSLGLGVRLVQRIFDVATNRDAGTVTVTARTKDPILSIALVDTFASLLDETQRGLRRDGAGAERRFAAAQYAIAMDSLAGSEDRVKAFLIANHSIAGSPELQLQQARLSRQVDQWQQVTVALAQSLEQAKLEEVRNTPALAFLQHGANSVNVSGGVVSDFILGAAIGVVLVLCGAGGCIRSYGWIVADPVRTNSVEALRRAFMAEFHGLIGILQRKPHP